MRVDDFICLGRTVPEESRKYGHRVCMAGYSNELDQLMRVYPLAVKNSIRSGRMYSIELCRNQHDSRGESWRLKDDGSVHFVSDVSSKGIRQDLTRFCQDSIDSLNESRKSLGVIHSCGDIHGEFCERSGAVNELQQTLFEISDAAFGADAIDLMPYLCFFDKAGPHRLQIREWGCYEWIRKRRDDASQLWRNLHLELPQLLVVGNMANRRNVWLVIKSYALKETKQSLLGFE